MKKYEIGRVYALRSPHTEKIYIGSTVVPLYKRFWQHKTDYKNKEKKISSEEIFNAGDPYIELIEQYNNLTKEELNKYEGEYIRKNKNCINERIAGRTKKQYLQDNKSIISIKMKEYKNNNFEKIKDYEKNYYQKNKEQIKNKQKDYYQKIKKI